MSDEIKLNEAGAADASAKMSTQQQHLQAANESLAKAADALASAGQGATADAADNAMAMLGMMGRILFDTSGAHLSMFDAAAVALSEADEIAASSMWGGDGV